MPLLRKCQNQHINQYSVPYAFSISKKLNQIMFTLIASRENFVIQLEQNPFDMLIVATSLFLFAFPTLATALPRFEVHWESEKSYEDVDPLVSPWHIRLGKLLKKGLR